MTKKYREFILIDDKKVYLDDVKVQREKVPPTNFEDFFRKVAHMDDFFGLVIKADPSSKTLFLWNNERAMNKLGINVEKEEHNLDLAEFEVFHNSRYDDEKLDPWVKLADTGVFAYVEIVMLVFN